jgi:hypothetical protein
MGMTGMDGAADGRQITAGAFSARVVEGDLRRLTFSGTEVLRRISMPVRDASWGTFPVRTTSERQEPGRYVHAFEAADGGFAGEFAVTLDAAEPGRGGLTADLTLTARRALRVNRAGFTLLHPIAGVAGTEMAVTHPDGRRTATRFPLHISPGQPARDIAGLTHRVGPVVISITMDGEVFEMEDQRNWSDASFKTYCRPLSLPRPYDLPAGSTVRQRLRITLREIAGATPASAAVPARGRMPQVLLAGDGAVAPDAANIGLLARVTGQTSDAVLARLRPEALEIVCDDAADLSRTLDRCHRAWVRPGRVVALPAAYLQSHQPEGPWPQGMTPGDAIPLLRAAFPDAMVGAGSLTNFTEFNRCRPDPATCDFATFGSTAIVHAADDLSVIETLEALPQILASAHAIMGGKPLHLGLISIGMRSNPYGAGVMPNPGGLRLPMAMADPRQETAFAAAYAVGVLVAAIGGRVDSLALAMTDGPLRATGRPLARVIAGAAALAGADMTSEVKDGVFRLSGDRGGMVANLSASGVLTDRAGLRLTERGPVAADAGHLLAPAEVLLWGEAA